MKHNITFTICLAALTLAGASRPTHAIGPPFQLRNHALSVAVDPEGRILSVVDVASERDFVTPSEKPVPLYAITLIDRQNKRTQVSSGQAGKVTHQLAADGRSLEFVEEEGQLAQEGERLLGSSEVLESIIGKFKYLAGERGQHGMTGMVLSIGALVGSQLVGTVQAAMQGTATHDVWTWCRSHLGPTVQSIPRRITQALNQEQKQKPLCLENG